MRKVYDGFSGEAIFTLASISADEVSDSFACISSIALLLYLPDGSFGRFAAVNFPSTASSATWRSSAVEREENCTGRSPVFAAAVFA